MNGIVDESLRALLDVPFFSWPLLGQPKNGRENKYPEEHQKGQCVMQSFESAPSPAPPCVVIIFGASGDLTHRKLIPALQNLAREGLLSSSFAVVGVATRPWTNEAFRSRALSDESASIMNTA